MIQAKFYHRFRRYYRRFTVAGVFAYKGRYTIIYEDGSGTHLSRWLYRLDSVKIDDDKWSKGGESGYAAGERMV